jgi:outer membrane protein assembly factor BamB
LAGKRQVAFAQYLVSAGERPNKIGGPRCQQLQWQAHDNRSRDGLSSATIFSAESFLSMRPATRLHSFDWHAVVLFAATAVALLLEQRCFAQASSGLLRREQISRLGLTRAWFAQVEMDPARHQVARAVVAGNQLFVLTTGGTLHAFDAQTGATMWVSTPGNPDWPSLGPAANQDQVAFVNGSNLYVLRRDNGEPTIVRHIVGATGASPAMSRTFCYVPMVNGRVEGYSLASSTAQPWFFQSQGRAMVAPLTTDASLVWTTNIGHVYVANGLVPGIRFRIETGSEIVASPSYRSPIVFVGTVNGEVIALHEQTGAEQWRFAAEYPITRSPAAVGGRVFATTERPTLFAIDLITGHPLWQAPKVRQFAAASAQRVYGMDNLNALVVLDASSGAVLTRMPSDGRSTALVNDQTDRLYLVSSDGKVQCLHEIGLPTPLIHTPAPAAPAEATPGTPAEAAPTQPAAPPSADESPFGAPAAAPPAANEDPFGGGATPPPASGDNPFGDLFGN